MLVQCTVGAQGWAQLSCWQRQGYTSRGHMLLSPNQGKLALVPAGCCVRGNAAFLAQEGAKAQPGPRPSTPWATFLPEEVP